MANGDYTLLESAEQDKKKLQTEYADLQKRCKEKFEELKNVEIAAEYIRSKLNAAQVKAEATKRHEDTENKPPPNKPSEPSFIDGTIAILTDAGKALHISKIIEELKARYDKDTNTRNLSGNIGKDGLKRFVNLGNNTWDLTSRYNAADSNQLLLNINGEN